MPANRKQPPWTEAEEQKLVALWSNREIKDIATLFGRSVSGIRHKAKSLRLGLPFHKTPEGRPWTDDEDAQLAFLWGEQDILDIAAKLKRTPVAITRRAAHLELGPPHDGGKTMNELSRFSGYAVSQLHFVVKTLGLHLRRRRRASIEQSKYVRSFSISEAQEEAVLAWLKKQPDGRLLRKQKVG